MTLFDSVKEYKRKQEIIQQQLKVYLYKQNKLQNSIIECNAKKKMLKNQLKENKRICKQLQNKVDNIQLFSNKLKFYWIYKNTGLTKYEVLEFLQHLYIHEFTKLQNIKNSTEFVDFFVANWETVENIEQYIVMQRKQGKLIDVPTLNTIYNDSKFVVLSTGKLLASL